MSLKEIAQLPVEEWNGRMVNDFEESVFPQFPTIGEIKEEMYRQGAVYASMSGSGSSVYGLFKEDAVLPEVDFGEKALYTKAGSLMFKNASTNILISGNKTQQGCSYRKLKTTLIMKSSNSVVWQDYLSCCQCPLLRKDVFP